MMPGDELEHRNGEPVIVTPVATILGKIQSEQAAGFARLETQLAGKADKGDIIRLETTQREHGDRLLKLEQDRKVRETRETAKADGERHVLTKRQARWTVLLGIGVILATVLGPIIDHLVR